MALLKYAVARYRTPELKSCMCNFVYAGSGMLVRSIPYQTAPSAKQAAWLLHCAVLGAVIAPICLLGENKSDPECFVSRIRIFSIWCRGSASKN
jgi:hypothetical protein